jgi:TonB family protein
VWIGITSTLAAFFGGKFLDQILFPINYQILFGIAFAASLMSQYYAQIWSKVRQNWALPSSILADKNLEAILDVTVLRSGQVTNISFEKRSGNSYFDQSAYRAIRKSDPFPPLPAWIQDSSVELGIKFHSAEYKR